MAVYTPLFVYLTPASIPQVVAHIQKYLADNPIVSDPEAIAEAIQEYIEAHPEIIAVASVNGKTGNVVLTGSDININASSAVSVETQLQNLASMIQSASGDITQIEAQLETIYTNIGTIETNVSNNTSAISALQTSVEGQGTRLATAESDIDVLESAQSAQNTRLNTAEGNISSLQTRMTQAESDIDSNESDIGTLQTNVQTIQTFLNNSETKNIDFNSLNITLPSGVTIPSTSNNISILSGNILYLAMSLVLSDTIPSGGHVDKTITLNPSSFTIVGGVGNTIQGDTIDSVFIEGDIGIRFRGSAPRLRALIMVRKR